VGFSVRTVALLGNRLSKMLQYFFFVPKWVVRALAH
jgi:hypothetical protein